MSLAATNPRQKQIMIFLIIHICHMIRSTSNGLNAAVSTTKLEAQDQGTPLKHLLALKKGGTRKLKTLS